MKKAISMIIVGFSIALIISGCGKKDGESYGQTISTRQTTDLKQILIQPADFEDKQITLEGKIVNQCPTGCWFDMQSGSAVIHVDINPSGFAIPQKPGKTVLVEGTVQVDGDNVEIIGTGVEIK